MHRFDAEAGVIPLFQKNMASYYTFFFSLCGYGRGAGGMDTPCRFCTFFVLTVLVPYLTTQKVQAQAEAEVFLEEEEERLRLSALLVLS